MPFPILEKSCLYSKVDTNSTDLSETGRGILESSPREKIQRYCQGKISFHGNIQRDVLFKEKVVLCYGCKTQHMLGENCPIITPTQKDSSMHCTEHSDTLSQNQNPIQPDPSAEILPCVKSLQQPSATTEDVVGGDHS